MTPRITGRRRRTTPAAAPMSETARTTQAMRGGRAGDIVTELIERLADDFGLIIGCETPGRADATFCYHFHVGDECHFHARVGGLGSVTDAIIYGVSDLLTDHEEDANEADADYEALLASLARGGLQILADGTGHGEDFTPSGTWAYRWQNGERIGGFATIEAAVEAGIRNAQPRTRPMTI